ncbi:P-loop containing nucleoside triphosphate hydrolase protein [Clohesyomyces aquaticus]|uniref:p-loop containing nucleoside triphosphate hydrolase protein n=1 Tax=Clohesyomyces aquaticus TaxID=1231657 RepID=A0A1Y2A6R8_9PLEO|nr:P-loop containing nucleoside triphosphate hydrolase protein [Clohesyomyces aquaticus]
MASAKGINHRDEMTLLSKQGNTGGIHDKFDASQFKSLVEKDVSPDVIEKLQKEFGDDMAGAVDKFHEIEEKSKRNSVSRTKSEDDEARDEDHVNDAGTDPLGRKPFVTRDRYWDKYKRQFVIQKPTKARRESKKHKNCVIFVRRDYSEDMTSFTTALVFSGSVLRNALRNIFRGAEGFGLTENESTELTPRFMFWARPELEMLAEHYQGTKDRKAAFEINSALKFIESEYEDLISVLPSLLPHSITFEYLWALLPPDCLVTGQTLLGFDSIWCVRSHSVQKMDDGVFLVMNAEFIVWDGAKVGNVRTMLRIPIFSGLKSVEDLPYIPLQYHPNREAVMERVLERSSKTTKFWRPGFSHQEHHGTGLAEVFDKVEQYPFSGRVMIDPKMMRQMQPANKIMPTVWDISDLRKTTRICLSELRTDDQPEILEKLLADASKTSVTDVEEPTIRLRRRTRLFGETAQDDFGNEMSDDSSSDSSSPTKSEAKKPRSRKGPDLSREQMLLVSGLLYGYSLREGKWGAFSVDRVAPIKWNKTIFDSLVVEKTLKDTIYKLVVAHSLGSSKFDDFVKGKGKGLIGLFFGPPGSGKTLTAEAIAETAKMPLYAVSSGSLGHEATQIHDQLSGILKLASHWKAVLLLDEADVFLAQRTITDIVRNAIVSVFLRELEYYQGILLLTTNQVEVIDEAFQSRIHLSIQYPSLDAPARLKIWENFMASARQSDGISVDVDQDSLRILAQMPLNGRQIKNTVSIAVKIATTSESHEITADNLRDTVRLLQNSHFSKQPNAEMGMK